MGSEGVRSGGWDTLGDGINGELPALGRGSFGESWIGQKSATWGKEEQTWRVNMNARRGAIAWSTWHGVGSIA